MYAIGGLAIVSLAAALAHTLYNGQALCVRTHAALLGHKAGNVVLHCVPQCGRIDRVWGPTTCRHAQVTAGDASGVAGAGASADAGAGASTMSSLPGWMAQDVVPSLGDCATHPRTCLDSRARAARVLIVRRDCAISDCTAELN